METSSVRQSDRGSVPTITVVGLPAGAVRESRDRVVTALAHAGFPVPPRRITVNLAPADVRKEGTGLDLPIALGILVATGALPPDAVDALAALGELALDGAIRPVRGALPIAAWAAEQGIRLVLPPANAPEAIRVPGAMLAVPATLDELVAALQAGTPLPPPARLPRSRGDAPPADDFAEVVGQGAAKRALEIAAAGGHNVLLVGPPGAGKTMLARRLPSILPALSDAEALEVLTVRSVAGLALDAAEEPVRPFRAPHHTVSAAGLVGGGSPPRPGEVSLAHLGVLFLDELLEFPRHVLDVLRQPLEDGRVVIARAAATIAYPARFTLVAATNPCPCGRAGDPSLACTCAPADVARYQARLSGPLADRIDMHVRVAAVPPRAIGAAAPAESSREVRERVERARGVQRARYGDAPGVSCNAQASGRALAAPALLDPPARDLLAAAAERLHLSARAYFRVVRVARTIADLDGDAVVRPPHVAEALRSRPAPAPIPADRVGMG